jgi:hypothetical protein
MPARISLAGPQSDVQGRMATATIGTGTLTLGAASTNATTFAGMPAPIADGDTLTYELVDIGVSPLGKEKGRGTYHSAGPTLSRDTVIWSTNGNAKLNLSGNAFVFVTADDSDVVLVSQARTLLTAATTFYIATNGSDANAGTSPGAPWATFAHAMAVLSGQIDFGGQTVTLQAVAGHANFTTQLSLLPWVGGGALVVDLGSGQISVTDRDALLAATALSGPVTIQNGTLTTATAGSCIAVSAPAKIIIGPGMIFGAAAFSHMAAGTSGLPGQSASATVILSPGGVISVQNNYTISGGANQHWMANTLCAISADTVSNTITLTGTPAFAHAFAFARYNGVMLVENNTFVGSAAGPRFLANTGGGIFTGGAGVNYLPGNAAGTVTDPGWYQ